MAQTARDLGVHAQTCQTWIGTYHQVERQAQQVNDAHLSEAVKRLRQANAFKTVQNGQVLIEETSNETHAASPSMTC
jgi:hypothetical protein